MAALLLVGVTPSTIEVACAEDLPPPKVRRTYGERANLSGTTTGPAEPASKSKVRIPEQQIPGGSSALVDELSGDAATPLPPPREANLPRTDKKDKLWSMKEEAPEAKPSGWGWLADDILRATQNTATESMVRNRWDDDGENDLDRDGQEDGTAKSDADGEKSAADQSPQSTYTRPQTEEELVKARLNEFRSESNPGWQPVGADQDQNRWPSTADVQDDPRDRTALAGMSFVAPEVVREATRQSSPDVDALTRSSASPDYLQNLNRLSEVNPQAGDRSAAGNSEALSVLPSYDQRSRGSEVGALNADATGSGSLSYGLPAVGPSFGGLSAVEVPPTLGSAAPLAPALTLPSQADSTPTMGVMGSEMEARPKTLPW